ncbi:MAG: hypothetical protein ACLFUS_06015 [Candidatus Sumerlaeia bacterium]
MSANRTGRFCAAILLALGMVLATSCATRQERAFGSYARKFWWGIPQTDFVRKETLPDAIRKAWPWPENAKLVQRVILEAGGKQYDFIGYLRVREGQSYRALALLEMGGTLFDFEWKNGAGRIRKAPEQMPPKPLMQGVLPDLAHLVLKPEGGDFDFYPTESDGLAQVIWHETNHATVLEVDDSGRMTRSFEWIDGKIPRNVAWSDWKVLPGLDREAPTLMILQNHRWHYRMEIRLLEVENLNPQKPKP